ncbi:hypothetical protein VTJ04DRAFT_7560 [Mycothermus thermophilus]|uniref:uncharacterized protein n=1 Tax=Humicola insolens TaxID=85995 RepID=UPI0037442C9B
MLYIPQTHLLRAIKMTKGILQSFFTCQSAHPNENPPCAKVPKLKRRSVLTRPPILNSCPRSLVMCRINPYRQGSGLCVAVLGIGLCVDCRH